MEWISFGNQSHKMADEVDFLFIKYDNNEDVDIKIKND